MKHSGSGRIALALLAVLVGAFVPARAPAQLFESLEAFESRLDVLDPAKEFWGGPKSVAAGDVDGNGTPDLVTSKVDGNLTVHLGQRDGGFAGAIHLATGTQSLRQVLVTDLTGDGLADIAAAALLDAAVVILENRGGGRFGEPRMLPTWPNARNLAAGDFNGDGLRDLAVGGSGVGLREYRGAAGGALRPVADLGALDAGGDSKPVYSLRTVRPGGAGADQLVVTHAWSDRVWILRQGPSGTLEARGMVPGISGVYHLDTGPITDSAQSERLDLVTAHRDLGTVQIRRGTAGSNLFERSIHQEIAIPGGPRAVKIVDLDDDGWNDLAVVLRYRNRVLVYRNDRGTLVPGSEMPTGHSPRDLAAGDFNADGEIDLAVINRKSFDISVLPGRRGEIGFSALDQVYLVDGDVSDLKVLDLNGDGRDDVVQLHRASGDVSVRLARVGGRLAPAVFYRLGERPSALELADVSGDGIPDVVSANLGHLRGSLSVRVGRRDGTFGPLLHLRLPPGVGGRLFALEVADFDGDGTPDVAAGFLDCRIALFRGESDGSFRFTSVHRFILEARGMDVGDFDRDGDLDLAGASFTGDVVVVENTGHLLDGGALEMKVYPSPTPGKFGSRDLRARDMNGDGDLDLVVASGNGVMVYHGTAGMGFVLDTLTVEGTSFPCSSVVATDFNGDGTPDIAVSCEVFSCIIIATQVEGRHGREIRAVLTVDVPAGRLLAAGDLDGDGHPDLVGSGDVLWTALSSRRGKLGPPPTLEAAREIARGPVINEILAINNDFPLLDDGGKKSDWVELFNGGPADIALKGWRLVIEKRDGEEKGFSFPGDAVLPGGGHLLVVHSSRQRTPLHTGFKLPGDGGSVVLLNDRGGEVDRVEYFPQFENVSLARYRDGLASFAFNPYPSPGSANVDNGSVPPVLKQESLGPLPLVAGRPIRFEASGRDDLGIVSASVLYRLADNPSEVQRVILYDDGLHDDGELQDGFFVGNLERPLPPGSRVEYFIEVEDLSGNTVRIPEDARFTGSIGEEMLHRFVVGASGAPTLELSELVALNETGLKDEQGGTPDWVEIRNCSAKPLFLGDYRLGKRYPGYDRWYTLPPRLLEPGGHLVIFCDGNPEQGPLHADFRLGAGGDRLVLTRRFENSAGGVEPGFFQVVDALEFGPQEADVALARRGCGGNWESAPPTPGAQNGITAVAIGDVNADGKINVTDPIHILLHLFRGGPAGCERAADANSDGGVDISDPTYLLNYLFRGGPPPADGTVECR